MEVIPTLWLGGSLPQHEKKEILFSLLKIKSVVSVHVNFEGIEGISELLKILTSRLFDSLNLYRELNQLQLQYTQFRSIFSSNKSLPEFCKNLGFLQEELSKNESLMNSGANDLSLVFIFENVSAWGAKLFLDGDFRQTFPKVSYHRFQFSHPNLLFSKLSKWKKLGIIFIQQFPSLNRKNHFLRPDDIQITFQAYSELEMKKFIMQKLQKFLTDIFPTTNEPNFLVFQSRCLSNCKKILEVIPICMSCGITSRDELYSVLCGLWHRLYKESLPASCFTILKGFDTSLIQSKYAEPTTQNLKLHFEELIQQSMFLTPSEIVQSYADQVVKQLPLKLQYLIISAYLAANNPKSSDDLTFLSEKNKKRKWSKISSTENLKENSDERSGINGRTFSVERLLSIYAQILHINEGISTIDYGSPELQSALETLTLRKFLWKSQNWKPSKPMYGANIRGGVAEEIARSLRFPLDDFLYDSSRNHFKW